MKIGILTFHRSYNYGAFMQCFSLVSRLKKDFPEIEFEVIDYSSKRAMDGYTNSLNNIADAELKNKIRARNDSFIPCQNQLPLSDFSLVSDNYDELYTYMNENYDGIVVGSDAVWNWNVRGFPNPYFLKDYKGHKFSYAASAHGMNYQNMTSEQKEYIKEAFLQFDYIGVRDVTTEKMVEFADESIKTNHNCDPTAFLDLNEVPCDMEKLKEKLSKKGVDFSKPLIGVMAGNKIGREIKAKWKNKAQIVAVYQPNKYADVYLNDLTPFEWAHVFSFFKVTVTHFFHGTMLSLVNSVPVIPVEFTDSFSAINVTKINDAMDRLGLSDWRKCANYKNSSIIVKAMRKYGILKDKKLWNGVNSQIAEFLTNDYSSIIKEKIQIEAANYNSFKQAIKKIYEGEVKNG